MRKSFSSLLSLVFVATSAAATAQSDSVTYPTVAKTIQVATTKAQAPVMSYEVAALIQTLQKAQAQYRISGQSNDLARVDAVRRELASRGFGRATMLAPVQVADNALATASETAVRVSSVAQ